MEQEVLLLLDNDVYEKFNLALCLTHEDENEVIERFMRNYIAKSFGRTSQEYSINEEKQIISNLDKDYEGKAIQRIPHWALKPNQYNHKIIRAFFEAERIMGEVTIDAMERLCSDRERSELYVPTFKNNYAQMKIDGPKSYGKVFEDDGKRVWIWKEVENVLYRYKDKFLS